MVYIAMNDAIRLAQTTHVTDSRVLALGVASLENTGYFATSCVMQTVVEEPVSRIRGRALVDVKSASMA